jgi:hypothetical protein
MAADNEKATGAEILKMYLAPKFIRRVNKACFGGNCGFETYKFFGVALFKLDKLPTAQYSCK